MTFEPTWDSLQQYRCPDWFQDAKFGIWAHWGPQAVPMVGDWYARHMYVEGHRQALHHRRVYGHPSKFGYKDIVRLWKAERFDPDRLLDLYKRCGARYFTACGVHHDNFDCWDSKHHRWNSVKVGPGKDIVGLFEKAARAAGLKFGVTEHLERAYSWFNTNKGADSHGPFAGIPYDGNDPEYADFYFEKHDDTSQNYPSNPSQAWVEHWYNRITDLIDRYDPDLLYTDGGVPFGEVGRRMIAHFYNRNIARRGGKLEAVYAVKNFHTPGIPKDIAEAHGEYREGIGVLDVERGVIDDISPEPWQTDTCVGGWYYDTQQVYKTPEQVIHMLADIVSKNGCLLLNLPPRPDGTLDEEEVWIAEQIGKWLEINGEAIYGTRPWVRFGEGTTRYTAGIFAEKEAKQFTPGDFRFTRNGDTLYAIAMAWPADRSLTIQSLADGQGPDSISKVSLLGAGPVTEFKRDGEGLKLSLPEKRPCDYAYVIKIQ